MLVQINEIQEDVNILLPNGLGDINDHFSYSQMDWDVLMTIFFSNRDHCTFSSQWDHFAPILTNRSFLDFDQNIKHILAMNNISICSNTYLFFSPLPLRSLSSSSHS